MSFDYYETEDLHNENGYTDSYGRPHSMAIIRDHKDDIRPRFRLTSSKPEDVATWYFNQPRELMKIEEFVCIYMDAMDVDEKLFDKLCAEEKQIRIKRMIERMKDVK